MTPFDLAPPSPAQRARLEADLTPAEAEVLLRHGTEAPFCGLLLNEHRTGRPLADVVVTIADPMLIMQREGVFAKYDRRRRSLIPKS